VLIGQQDDVVGALHQLRQALELGQSLAIRLGLFAPGDVAERHPAHRRGVATTERHTAIEAHPERRCVRAFYAQFAALWRAGFKEPSAMPVVYV
jgi:hypothetical protein